MFSSMWILVLLAVNCYCWTMQTSQLYEGDTCATHNTSGVCKIITDCPQAVADLQKGIHPQVCGFKKKEAVVCCQSEVSLNLKSVNQDCGPIPTEASRVQRTGSKAWDKCIENLQYVYPCKNGPSQKECSVNEKSCKNTTIQRQYTCKHYVPAYIPSGDDDEIVQATAIGGIDAKENEFPHMALLGFGSTVESANWLCGGSVISENYVLTAGHCTFAKDYEVKFVRVGMVKMSNPIDPSRLHRVAQVIKHPDYKSPNKYNDIALLKTATPIILDSQVYPACLHTGNAVNDYVMVATGWGALSYGGKRSEILQKVVLQKFGTKRCTPLISSSRTLKSGLNKDTQLCAGHHFLRKDTCQGDSGGPLQVLNKDVNCMYTVVGVTSFGWGCGIVGVPGVYTRVSFYISWIESIVWP